MWSEFKDPQAHKALQVTRGLKGLEASRVFKVQPESKESQERPVPSVSPDLQDLSESPDFKAPRESQVSRGPVASMAPRGRSERKVRLVWQAQRDLRGVLDPRGTMEIAEVAECKAHPVLMVPRAHKGKLVPKV